MEDIEFLKKKYGEKKIKFIEPSVDISFTYFENSKDEILASKIMIKQKLYSQSITHSYYSMYLALQSLFFICGFKCEDHGASISILKIIFDIDNSTIIKAKKERIDVQYYIKGNIVEETAICFMKEAEKFSALIHEKKEKYSLKDYSQFGSKLREVIEK